jgi:hypothetical protein
VSSPDRATPSTFRLSCRSRAETSAQANARSKWTKLTASANGAARPVAKGVPLIAVLPRTERLETVFLKTGLRKLGLRSGELSLEALLDKELLVTRQPIRRKRESGSDTIW